jgi:hypothetical protein
MRKRRFGLLAVSTFSFPCVDAAGGWTGDGGFGGFGDLRVAQGGGGPERSPPFDDSAIVDMTSLATSLMPAKWYLSPCLDLARRTSDGCAAAGGSPLSVEGFFEAFVFLNIENSRVS